MVTQIVFQVTESFDGGFEASAVGQRIHTQAETWDELKEMVRDAVKCHFDEAEAPSVIKLLLTREEVLSA